MRCNHTANRVEYAFDVQQQQSYDEDDNIIDKSTNIRFECNFARYGIFISYFGHSR